MHLDFAQAAEMQRIRGLGLDARRECVPVCEHMTGTPTIQQQLSYLKKLGSSRGTQPEVDPL